MPAAHHRSLIARLCSLSQWQRLRHCPAAPGCRLIRTRYGHPLRGPSGLHNAALPSVPASQSQAPFVAATASRPSGEGNKRYAKWPSLGSVASAGGASPVALRPSAFACAPCGSASTWALVSALPRSGASQRPVGRSSRVSPRPPLCFAAARHQHSAGCPIRPPRGLPQPGAENWRPRELVPPEVPRFGCGASPVLAQQKANP